MLLTSRRPVLSTKLKRCDVTLPPGGAGAEPPPLMTLNKPWYFSLKKPRISEVGIPQFEAQSASCATSARAEVAKRFNKLFLTITQVALRFKENKSFLRFIALRTEKIYNNVRIIALRTEKNLVACALLRCALSEVEILRCALSD